VPTDHLNLTDVLPFFAGSIPESLGQLKKLMHLLLYGNQLSGRLLTYMIFVLPYDKQSDFHRFSTQEPSPNPWETWKI